MAAEGVMNPILLKWYTTSWDHEVFLPHAYETYRQLEQLLDTRFFSETPISKVFPEERDKKLWIKKSPSLPQLQPPEEEPENIKAPYGIGTVKGTSILDVRKFLMSSREYFERKGFLSDLKFSHADLQLSESGNNWMNVTFDFVIFCEGHRISENPYFDFLPITPVQGESIRLILKGNLKKVVWNKRIFLVPFENEEWMAGATYSWELLTGPTEEALLDMTGKLNDLLRIKYEVTEQLWGLRPAVPDRRPIIGPHPQFKGLYVLNGMGSKGISLSPFFTDHLAEHLIDKKPLIPEIDIKRFC